MGRCVIFVLRQWCSSKVRGFGVVKFKLFKSDGIAIVDRVYTRSRNFKLGQESQGIHSEVKNFKILTDVFLFYKFIMFDF